MVVFHILAINFCPSILILALTIPFYISSSDSKSISLLSLAIDVSSYTLSYFHDSIFPFYHLFLYIMLVSSKLPIMIYLIPSPMIELITTKKILDSTLLQFLPFEDETDYCYIDSLYLFTKNCTICTSILETLVRDLLLTILLIFYFLF